MSFGSKDFWDLWYEGNLPDIKEDQQKNAVIDWYIDFQQIKELLNKFIRKTDSVLFVGCGNSIVAELMAKEGHAGRLVNVDFSSTVIEYMKKKFAKRENIEYLVGDVSNLKDVFPENQVFDVILDKGTMDAMLTSDRSYETIPKMLEEVRRLLKQDGRYVVINSLEEGSLSSGSAGAYFQRFEWEEEASLQIQNDKPLYSFSPSKTYHCRVLRYK